MRSVSTGLGQRKTTSKGYGRIFGEKSGLEEKAHVAGFKNAVQLDPMDLKGPGRGSMRGKEKNSQGGGKAATDRERVIRGKKFLTCKEKIRPQKAERREMTRVGNKKSGPFLTKVKSREGKTCGGSRRQRVVLINEKEELPLSRYTVRKK